MSQRDEVLLRQARSPATTQRGPTHDDMRLLADQGSRFLIFFANWLRRVYGLSKDAS